MNSSPIHIDQETARLVVEFYSTNRALKSLLESETWQHLKQLTQGYTELHDHMNALWNEKDPQALRNGMQEIVNHLKTMEALATTLERTNDNERFMELITEILAISKKLKLQLLK